MFCAVYIHLLYNTFFQRRIIKSDLPAHVWTCSHACVCMFVVVPTRVNYFAEKCDTDET